MGLGLAEQCAASSTSPLLQGFAQAFCLTRASQQDSKVAEASSNAGKGKLAFPTMKNDHSVKMMINWCDHGVITFMICQLNWAETCSCETCKMSGAS